MHKERDNSVEASECPRDHQVLAIEVTLDREDKALKQSFAFIDTWLYCHHNAQWQGHSLYGGGHSYFNIELDSQEAKAEGERRGQVIDWWGWDHGQKKTGRRNKKQVTFVAGRVTSTGIARYNGRVAEEGASWSSKHRDYNWWCFHGFHSWKHFHEERLDIRIW